MAVLYPPQGKVALITGAARGIGYETARQLHAKGASVAVLDLDREAAQQACDSIGERTLAIDADVTDSAAMRLAVNQVVERFGGLDIVVANAGIAPPVRPMTKIGPEAFERVIEIDLHGVWRTVHAALPQVVDRRGHIVVIASVYAFVNGVLASPYAIAKAGVEQLGRALRAELRIHGASASTAYFGFIDTDMVRDAFEDRVTQQLEEMYPKWLLRRLPPSAAGAAIVSGIERRAPRIILPRWWGIWSTFRGVINPPLDRLMERDERVLEAVRMGEESPPT
ncbi:MAG TPA: SDR family oxidoreductase [Solirubrobacterales bacterium]|nr:SDR family oxidoreductase [Solirubrobacterales bacterium]